MEQGTGSLAGRVAIVTGAADGPKAALGATFARALAADGAAVLAVDVSDTASVVAAIRAAGGTAEGLHADLAERDAAARMATAAVDLFGRIDILVNNAALGSNAAPSTLDTLDADAWDALMAVNVRGLMLAVQAVAPAMAQAGYGKIVNLGSPMVADGAVRRLAYVASKGAVHAMTRALARELGPSGIRVNTLTPGLPLTPFNQAAMDRMPGFEDRLLAARSIPRHLDPQDFARVLCFLASADSDAMTGQHLLVDHGTAFT